MNTINSKLILLTLAAATLSACTPMTPPSQDIAINTTGTVEQPGMTPILHPAPLPAPTIAQQQYVVQLIASSNPTKAEGIKNRFTQAGYSTFVSPLDVNGKLLHRVQIGYYKDLRDAEMTLNQMRKRYPNDAYVSTAVVKTP